jgi:hypothetical protein
MIVIVALILIVDPHILQADLFLKCTLAFGYLRIFLDYNSIKRFQNFMQKLLSLLRYYYCNTIIIALTIQFLTLELNTKKLIQVAYFLWVRM